MHTLRPCKENDIKAKNKMKEQAASTRHQHLRCFCYSCYYNNVSEVSLLLYMYMYGCMYTVFYRDYAHLTVCCTTGGMGLISIVCLEIAPTHK